MLNNPDRKSPDWDLLVLLHQHVFLAEVKVDLMAPRTGNLAIEWWNPRRNGPSGISATTADLWFVLVGKDLWVAPVPALKSFFHSNPGRDVMGAGDGNSTVRLYPCSSLLNSIFSLAESHARLLTSLQ